MLVCEILKNFQRVNFVSSFGAVFGAVWRIFVELSVILVIQNKLSTTPSHPVPDLSLHVGVNWFGSRQRNVVAE